MLQAQGIDCAVLGFNIDDLALDILQIQGGHRKYRELTPVLWDKLLIYAAIKAAAETGRRRVTMVTSFSVEGYEPEIAKVERLSRRYDQNAAYFGFRMNSNSNRYVLETSSWTHLGS